mmetsp:Transcript_7265/g.9231  ORF Transcript_7265/g.9231 Transcript_7265/m.9231 type:complete len:118 (-) Transcript_7265:861-1214(-)
MQVPHVRGQVVLIPSTVEQRLTVSSSATHLQVLNSLLPLYGNLKGTVESAQFWQLEQDRGQCPFTPVSLHLSFGMTLTQEQYMNRPLVLNRNGESSQADRVGEDVVTTGEGVVSILG